MDIRKIKQTGFETLLLIFLSLLLLNPARACTRETIYGFTKLCEDWYFGTKQYGLYCGEAYIPKPDQMPAGEVFMRPMVKIRAGSCHPSWFFLFFYKVHRCLLGVNLLFSRLFPNPMDLWAAYMESPNWFFQLLRYIIPSLFVVETEAYSDGLREYFSDSLIVDSSSGYDVYSGGNCELIVKNGKSPSVAFRGMDLAYFSCSPSSSGAIEKAACKKPVYESSQLPEYYDCTEKYGGKCAYECGASIACHLFSKNSIGTCTDYWLGYEACLCNENCQPERVEWGDIFTVSYIVNGIQLGTTKETITYYCGDEDVEVRVRVDVSDKFKNKFNTEGAVVSIDVATIRRGDFDAHASYETQLGRETTLKLRCGQYEKYIWNILHIITPTVTKTTLSGRNLIIALPAKLRLTYGQDTTSPCTTYSLQGKNFVVLANGSSLYDPDLEIWNKCCRDGVIEVEVEKMERQEGSWAFGLPIVTYLYNITVKDNRDQTCENLFGTFDLSINTELREEKIPLKSGENQFESNATILPSIR